MRSRYGILALLVFLSAAVVVAACSGSDAPATPASATAVSTAGVQPLVFAKLLDGFQRPTFVTNAGDGSGRLFVVEKAGDIRVIQDGQLLPDPLLDIRDLVDSEENERGLLGLAFHPDFAHNGRFFVAYTAAGSEADTLAEYQLTQGATSADPATGTVLLAIPDKFSNHNGGMLAFGADGYLYMGTGDGGSQDDPDGNGQNLDALLAKILRIDVDSARPYAVPSNNPFASESTAHGEIWAYGLRNPWRFSFDRQTHDLWIADVGGSRREEIDFQAAGDAGGTNYGWSVIEGSLCLKPATNCDTSGKTPPIYEYSHDDGSCAVIGGYVYRGSAIPDLEGTYLFADYCQAWLRGIRRDGGKATVVALGTAPQGLSAFGEDEAGELYAVSDMGGTLYRITR
jgi:glucose/arabinose dehydrogenase